MGELTRTSSKIFGIGLSKTGTSSLARALEILGYRTKDYLGVIRYAAGDLSSIDLSIIDQNDAFTDTPIPSFYRELDARYPGSKFILTVRDGDGWLRSCKKQFTQRLAEKQNEAHKRLFLDLYGTDVFDEQKFVSGYERFVSGVLEYFRKRPNDLLVVDIAGGDGWEALCRFLNKPVPDIPFPKANVTHVRWLAMTDIVAVARKAGGEIRSVYGNHPGAPTTRDGHHRSRDILQGNPGGMVRRSIGAAIYAMCGGDEGARGRAAKRANRAIYDGLRKLVPEIPIISSVSPKISDAERAKCNHLWLVDPLGGVDPVLDGESEIAVSVALVEDGRAIYGVVYAPFTDTVYYGRLGQGAYKAERGGVPERIEIPGSDSAPSAAALDRTERVVRGLHNEHRTPPRSPALAVCVRLADGSGAYSRPEPAMEWETAAAHAIATAAGRRLCDPASGEELRYNKKDLVARPFVVE